MSLTRLSSLMSAAELAALRGVGHLHKARPGQAILTKGQVPDCVLLLEKGNVKVTTLTREGDEVVLGLRSAGELVGEQGIFDGRPRSATVVAIDQLEYLVVSDAEFWRFLEQHPRVTKLLLSMLSERLREANHAQTSYVARDTVSRLAIRLLELADRFGQPSTEGVRIALPLTQEELAGWTAASLEATARALRQMRELGWIQTGRRQLIIKDQESLRRRTA